MPLPSSPECADLPVVEGALALPGPRLGLGLDDHHPAPAVCARQRQRVRLEVGLALVTADAALQCDHDVGPLTTKTASGSRGARQKRC